MQFDLFFTNGLGDTDSKNFTTIAQLEDFLSEIESGAVEIKEHDCFAIKGVDCVHAWQFANSRDYLDQVETLVRAITI